MVVVVGVVVAILLHRHIEANNERSDSLAARALNEQNAFVQKLNESNNVLIFTFRRDMPGLIGVEFKERSSAERAAGDIQENGAPWFCARIRSVTGNLHGVLRERGFSRMLFLAGASHASCAI